MNEILKKLPELTRGAVERTLELLDGFEPTDTNLRWRLYGMADILLAEHRISIDEYYEMLKYCQTCKKTEVA